VDNWEEVTSEIVVESRLAEALEGIEGFSHILVLFWMDRVNDEQRAIRRLHPRDRQDLPLMGVFATRTQYRPNPIGATVARLLECRGNLLRVRGLDALDGTPVLDIKPYLPDLEPGEEVTAPPWVRGMGRR
jgi:tRNA-Thr(GGU) m(6)t(6)A37 methyltransferase TsaA